MAKYKALFDLSDDIKKGDEVPEEQALVLLGMYAVPHVEKIEGSEVKSEDKTSKKSK